MEGKMDRLSRTKTLAYSAGNLAAGVYFAFNNFVLGPYLRLFTHDNVLIGWLTSTRSFEQSVVQPLVGAWSDSTWTRLGRRAPFYLTGMFLSAALIAINALIPVPIIPPDVTWLPLVVLAIFTFSFVFNLGFDPYVALLADVTPSEQRASVNGIAGILGAAGSIAILVLAAILFQTHLSWLFYLVAGTLVVGFGVVALVVRESKHLADEERQGGISLSMLVAQMRRRLVDRPAVPIIGAAAGLAVFGISSRFAPEPASIALGLVAGILLGMVTGLGWGKLFIEGFTPSRLSRLPILFLAGLLNGTIVGGLVGGLVAFVPGLIVFIFQGWTSALLVGGFILILIGSAVGSLAGWLAGDYILGLYTEQREAAKLLAVRFLYQFGINAAAPFIIFFVTDEIGTRGWAEFVTGFPMLATMGLGSMDAQALAFLIGGDFILMSGLWTIVCGFLADRYGKKRIFGLGLFVFGISAWFAAFAATIPQLLFYLIFIGFGNAAQTVLFFPYLSDLIPASRVGEFQGLSAMAETGGYFLSILVAGELLNLNLFNLHYRLIFVITGIFLLLAVLALIFVKGKIELAAEPLSTPG
jgi:MFS family permease